MIAPPRTLAAQIGHTFVTLLLGQGIAIAAGIAIAHRYGPVGKGIVSYADYVLLLVVAAGDGLAAAVIYAILRNGEAPGLVRRAMRPIVIAYGVPILAFLLAGAALWHGERMLAAVALAAPAILITQYCGGYLFAKQAVEPVNIATVVTNAVGSIALIVCCIVAAPIWIVLAFWAVSWWTGAVMLGRLLPRIAAERSTRALVMQQTTFSLRASGGAVVSLLSVQADMYVVGAFADPRALGIYTLALAVGAMMWHFSRAVAYPSYGRLADLPIEASAQLLARLARMMIAIDVVCALGVAVIAKPAVSFVYGADFISAAHVVLFLLPGYVLYGADPLLTQFLSVRTGRPGLTGAIETVSLVVTVVASIALIPRLGITGAAIATSIAHIVRFGAKVAFISRYTGSSPLRFVVLRASDVREIGALVRARFARATLASTNG